MSKSNKGEEGTGTVLQTIQGVLLAALGIAFFFIIVQTILSIFGDKDYCEDSADNLNLLYNKINDVASTNNNDQAIFTINPGCVLIGLNKYGNNLAEKPSICYEKACLCLCNLKGDENNPYDCEGEVCSVFSELELIKGDYKTENLKDVFFLYASKDKTIGPGPEVTTRHILNISKIDKGIYIKNLESKGVKQNE